MYILTLPLPLTVEEIIVADIVGCSRGLVCLCGRAPDWDDVWSRTVMALLWNPSIRKMVVVTAPTGSSGLGFGVCPVTNDPKIVSFKCSSWKTGYHCEEVLVYSLSYGKSTILSTNLPTQPIRVSSTCSALFALLNPR
ncbi:unnamed protein product [Lactuca virosa]|uniref:Uncharacterized protein n=1 Tax=Lactuca virosa TaxID=75947 RepID=A0AAU9MSS9_9ASTR|nr:unnamed protein product [Lactuca virosa]